MFFFCVYVKSFDYNIYVESVNCVDKFLFSVLNIFIFSYVNFYI